MFYVVGTVDELMAKGEVDVELAEIAIDLQPWFSYGPYLRLAFKIATAIMAREVMSSFSSRTAENIREGKVASSIGKEKAEKYSNV